VAEIEILRERAIVEGTPEVMCEFAIVFYFAPNYTSELPTVKE
jgi:hypothetical protein